jgi:hypothetical protein
LAVGAAYRSGDICVEAASCDQRIWKFHDRLDDLCAGDFDEETSTAVEKRVQLAR